MVFCVGASTIAVGVKVHPSSFPQKDLRKTNTMRVYHTHNFTLLIIQLVLDKTSGRKEIKDMCPLIWEAKLSKLSYTWFDEEKYKGQSFSDEFIPHFHQISVQVDLAKAKLDSSPIYALLSVNIWFILFSFPGDPPTMDWSAGECQS